MKLNLSELLNKKLLRKIPQDESTAKALLAKAAKDIQAAEDNFRTNNFDWSLAIAYNAMLSAGRALMVLKGYAPNSDSHHLAIVQYCAAVLIQDSSELVAAFNRYRIRRHDVVYGEEGSVGKEEAEKAIENAKKFVQKIKEKVLR